MSLDKNKSSQGENNSLKLKIITNKPKFFLIKKNRWQQHTAMDNGSEQHNSHIK